MTRRSLSPTMRGALELAASAAGLWCHRNHPGYYVPGLGTVPFNKRTVQGLEIRGLVQIREAPIDHDAVYADGVLRRGTLAQKVTPTREGLEAVEATR